MKLPSLVPILSALVMALAISGHDIDGAAPDVGTNQWAAGPPLADARADASATALGDGQVLVAGGRGAAGPTAGAEVLTVAGAAVPVPSMSVPRAGHIAASLGDGRVLIAGGTTTVTTETGTVESPTASAEVFDASGVWTPVAGLARARSGARALALPDGRVAVVGGRDATGAVLEVEIFDPLAGAFVAGGALSLPREDAGVTVTREGLIVVVGGTVDGVAQASADVIDPVTGVVAAVSLASARTGATATTTVDNQVLVIGGSDGTSMLASTELLDPSTGSSTTGPSLSSARTGHAAFALPGNGGVLVVGGAGGAGLAGDAEVVVPWAGVVQVTPAVAHPRTATAGAAGPAEGLFVVAGGRTADGAASSATDYYGFATVKTDKDDYAPGEFVTITGTGWQPGETVELVLHEVGTGAPDMPLNAVADEFGNFLNDFWAPNQSHLGVRFYLTATGAGATAQATFTDSLNLQNVTLSPNTITLQAGAQGSALVSLSFNGSGTCTATVTLQSVPSAIVAGLGPSLLQSVAVTAQANSSVTLNVSTTLATVPTTYSFTLLTTTPAQGGQGCSNSAISISRIATVVVTAAPDTVRPELTLPPPQLVEATSAPGAIVLYVATAIDDVDGPVPVSCGPASGSTFPLGTTTVNCSATDAAGNTANGSFNVTVQDTTAPAVSVPADITAEAASATGAIVTFAATATDIVSGALAPSCTPSSGSTFALGTTLVTCTATDGAGNTGSGSFNVSVVDTTAPAIQNVPADFSVEATSGAGAVASYAVPTAIDAVDPAPSIVCLPPSGTTFPLGTSTVTCTATDAAGNDSHASFEISVVDTTAPVLNLPGGITEEATGPGGAVVSFTATAMDVVDGSVAVNCAPVSGSTFPLGTTPVNCSATDAAGNTASGSFSVTVQDTTPPVVTVPADITEEATSAAGAVVTFSASATDLVDGAVATTCAPASGSAFPLGTTEVTCSAIDAAGNTGTATFDVTVEDTTAPVLQNMPADVVVEATGPGGAVATYSSPTATDLVDAAPAVICTPPSGNTFPLGGTIVTCTATDAAGNAANETFTVTVVDTTPPDLSLPAAITEEATGPSGAVVNYTATASDLVDGAVSTTCEPATSSTFALGTTTVNCSATDAAGNTASGSFSVTVQDTTPPVVTVPAPITEEATGPAGAVVTFSASATDAVSGALATSCTPASGTTFPIATTQVTCTATDAAGNTGSATFDVTVRDTTAPTLQNVPASFTVEATSPAGATATYTDPTATDIVDATPTVVCAPASGGTFPLGNSVVTCTATDDFGNNSQAQFTISVADTTSPTGAVVINGGALYTTSAMVTLGLTCVDVATGCAEMQLSQDGAPYGAFEPFSPAKSNTLAGADGAKTVSVKFRDGAGNVSAPYSDGITLDTTAPVITLTAPPNGASYALNQVVAASYTCTDATSGINACMGTAANGAAIDTGSVGAKSFSVNATDLAGNTATVTHTYGVNYVFNGFFTPVLNGVWNVVNAGRAIPLKWQLKDAAGSHVLNLGTVQSIYYAQVACSSESIAVPIEGYADDAGSSDLRITGTDYHFNWKTEKGFANKCLELRVTLNDGSAPHVAKFKFSK